MTSNILSKITPEEFISKANELSESYRQQESQTPKKKKRNPSIINPVVEVARIYYIHGPINLFLMLNGDIIEQAYIGYDHIQSVSFPVYKKFSAESYEEIIESMAERLKEKNKYVVVECTGTELSITQFRWSIHSVAIHSWPWDLNVKSKLDIQEDGLYITKINDIVIDDMAKTLIVTPLVKLPSISVIEKVMKEISQSDRLSSLHFGGMDYENPGMPLSWGFPNFIYPTVNMRQRPGVYSRYKPEEILNLILEGRFDFVKYNDEEYALTDIDSITMKVMKTIYMAPADYPLLTNKFNADLNEARFNRVQSYAAKIMNIKFVELCYSIDDDRYIGKLVSLMEENEKEWLEDIKKKEEKKATRKKEKEEREREV